MSREGGEGERSCDVALRVFGKRTKSYRWRRCVVSRASPVARVFVSSGSPGRSSSRSSSWRCRRRAQWQVSSGRARRNRKSVSSGAVEATVVRLGRRGSRTVPRRLGCQK